MKLFVTRAIQATLDAEIGERLRGARLFRRRNGSHDGVEFRSLLTRLGSVDLLLPVDHQTQLFARFAQAEAEVFRSLIAILVVGEASCDTVRSLAVELCGWTPSHDSTELIADRINFEVAGFMRRELLKDYPALCCTRRTRVQAFACDEA